MERKIKSQLISIINNYVIELIDNRVCSHPMKVSMELEKDIEKLIKDNYVHKSQLDSMIKIMRDDN